MRNRVLITGGSRGIGACCVEMFAMAGYRVAFFYNKSEVCAMKVADRSHAYAVKADVSDSHSVSEGIKASIDILGGIDVLVNNAGISAFSMFDEISDKAWHNIIDTNLSGVFYTCREVSKYMIREKYGRIINIGSVWGRCGSACEVHYSASKAGVRGLTMSLAKELGPSGITVNCIEPGVIDTDMNSVLSDEVLLQLKEETPVCRLGTAEDVARCVVFIADEGSSFITGQCIGVDGGFAI